MRNRIHILLFILTLAFFGTAYTIHLSIDDKDIFEYDTKTLSESIHKREKSIIQLFSDSNVLKVFQNAEKYPLQVSEISNRYVDSGIFFTIFKDHKPIQWNSSIYVPESDLGLNDEHTSFIKTSNRSFVFRKKELKDNMSVIAFVPIKRNYNSNNKYLQNIFNPNLLKQNNIDIASYNDIKNIRNIYSYEGKYLFSVKLKDGRKDNVYIDLQVLAWFLGVICLFFLTHSVCLQMAKKKRPWASLVLFGVLLIVYKILDVKLNWLPSISNSFLFDPDYYAYNKILSDFWSFLLISVSLFWLICYAHSIKKYLKIKTYFRRRYIAISIVLFGFMTIYAFANMLFIHLGDLITSTSLIEGLFNILEIETRNWLNILLFCFNITVLLLYIDWIVFISFYLIGNFNLALNVQLTALILSMVIIYFFEENSLYFNILLSIIIIIRSSKKYKYKELHVSALITSLLVISLMSSIALTKSIQSKREISMEKTIDLLNAEDDVNAVSLFDELENNIQNDKHLKQLFQITVPNTDGKAISEYIKNKFLSGYLSKFEFKGYYYYNGTIPLGDYDKNQLEHYREKIIRSSTKVNGTDFFYRLGTEVGTHEYLSQINIPLDEEEDVQLLLNLKNKSYSTSLPYPEFLTDSRLNIFEPELYNKTAFAIYRNNQLITQSGEYTYPESNLDFPNDLDEYIRQDGDDNFLHIIYNPDKRSTIVVSQTYLSIWEFLAVFSFIFIILYIFSTLFNTVNYVLETFREQSYRYRNIKYHFLLLRNKIRYSTRIQSLVIGSVITAIAFSGIIVFMSISKQVINNKHKEKLKDINIITKKIGNDLPLSSGNYSADVNSALKQLQDVSSKDFNIYDKSGRLIYSSQPRIYDLELISKYMNPRAFEQLNVLKKTETLEQEQVGNFKYDATYATIRDNDYQTLAFISFPNYSSLKEEIFSNNQLLNILMNIYTIVIILFGFLAVFVSNKITKPLSIIQRKLAQTTFSDKPNEPLYWERDDEIGIVVKEYNYMISKLEESTKKLKNAERESAWREMAKQIAHEVKNPLTPMKLGIQQLKRSQKDKDPKFEERFEKISNSFIDQIDSLSRIATEFSNFAKLPDTKISKIDLLKKIDKSINTFNNSRIASLKVENRSKKREIQVLGDRDQLLRAFNNLIKNAIEAAIVRRKLKVLFIVDIDENQENAIIAIKDNGIGISNELIPKIFQPNFTTKSSGTGLGLAFVKNAIEGMKGEITFKTQKGLGTTFFIKLPLNKDGK